MSEVCTSCNGKGRRKIGFFRTKVCGTCNGKGYIRAKPEPVKQNSILDTGNYTDDVITRVDLASMERRDSQQEFSTKEGAFGGAGATGHWNDSHSQTDHGHNSHHDHTSGSNDGGSNSGSSGSGD